MSAEAQMHEARGEAPATTASPPPASHASPASPAAAPAPTTAVTVPNRACMRARYQACMVLSSVGDAMGYRDSRWEFQKSGRIIHRELWSPEVSGGKGVAGIDLGRGAWRFSDDTVMHHATARALAAHKDTVAPRRSSGGGSSDRSGSSGGRVSGSGSHEGKAGADRDADGSANKSEEAREGAGGAASASECVQSAANAASGAGDIGSNTPVASTRSSLVYAPRSTAAPRGSSASRTTEASLPAASHYDGPAAGSAGPWHAAYNPAMYQRIAHEYKQCWSLMPGRSPGKTTCKVVVDVLHEGGTNWNHVPFNRRGGGCGAAMRAACIGLRFPCPSQLPQLIAAAVESGRLTHHHPTGYLGAFAAAFFTSLAVQGVPAQQWGARMIGQLPAVEAYVVACGREVRENTAAFREAFFADAWRAYLRLRGIDAVEKADCDAPKDCDVWACVGPAVFPERYGVPERDNFYRSVSSRGWGGASGHDSVMIAYDAVLGASAVRRGGGSTAGVDTGLASWVQLCERGVLHGGDNDSTGAIAGALWGAAHGFEGVPRCNYEHCEGVRTSRSLGDRLLARAEAAMRREGLVEDMDAATGAPKVSSGGGGGAAGKGVTVASGAASGAGAASEPS